MKIYVASSWRNEVQPHLVTHLRGHGHEVYDFRDPATAFKWEQIDPAWETWSVAGWKAALDHPLAVRGYSSDYSALQWCDATILVLPCGDDAHLELGWAAGQGKMTAIFAPWQSTRIRPGLMAKIADDLFDNIDDLTEWLSRSTSPKAQPLPKCVMCGTEVTTMEGHTCPRSSQQ